MRYKHSLFVALYFFLFLVLFLHFPLTGTLPGNTDSLLVIMLSNLHLENIFGWFNGTIPTVSMYPVIDPLAFGESSPGGAFIYLFFKIFSSNEVVTYYLYISTIFALNGFGVHLIATKLIDNKPTIYSFFAGLLFALSNMAFAHIDDSIVFFYFLPLASLYLAISFYQNRSLLHLYFSALLYAIEIYVSLYVFLYTSIVFLIIGLYFASKTLFTKQLLKHYGIILFFTILIFFPRFYYYFQNVGIYPLVTPFEAMYTTQMTSLQLFDFILALPGNFLYGWIYKAPMMNWGFVRHHNLIALSTIILAFYAFRAWNGQRKIFAIIAITGTVLAIGPYVMFGIESLFPSPLIVFYNYIPILQFLRVTSRAYFIVLLVFSLLATLSLRHLCGRWCSSRKQQVLAFTALSLLIFFENVPLPMKSFKMPIEAPIKVYDEVVKLDKNAVIVDLPALFSIEYLNWDEELFNDPARFVLATTQTPKLRVDNISMFYNSWDDIYQYNREILYGIYQTKHHLNTISGINGYFPVPRMIYQYHIERLPDKNAIKWLCEHDITHIVFHKNMVIKKDRLALSSLQVSSSLQLLYEDDFNALFSIVACRKIVQ
ncbi:hypothetical protein KAH37_07715 [bacterium]|nr:hypothetical protein [bacterium]